MREKIKKLSTFSINEGVNEDLIRAKNDVNAKQTEIATELNKQREAKDTVERADSIKKQATLYMQLAPLLIRMANAMVAKEASDDKTKIY